ncbi:cofG [Symbiodinium sp. CCMP2592]|nr:cofG [Symbiodinium sp. CCMP2592]
MYNTRGPLAFCNPLTLSRLGRPKDHTKLVREYDQRAEQSIVLRSAATAWADGVPWAEALHMAGVAQERAEAASARRDRVAGKGRGKQGGPRGKGRASADWHSQTAIAKAFHIGRNEAGAVQQLITAVPEDVKNALAAAVKRRGMVKFVGHEALARQIFSASYTNTSPGVDAWRDLLTNAPGDSRIASLLVERLVSDFDLAPEPLRKAPTYKETVTKHACCAAMLHFLGLLEAMCPGKEFPELRRQLMHQFHHGYLDTDLVHVLESAVPPADLKSVSAFRAVAVQIETQAQAEMDATQAEHARQVREATLAQITALVESDMKALRQRTPDHVLKAIATAKDLKYVKDRQTYGLCLCDYTVLPANVDYVRDSVELLANLLASSSNNLGHLQLPLPQRSMASSTSVKHRRTVEDLLMKAKINADSVTALLFEKPADASASDKRSLTQTCLTCLFSGFDATSWTASRVLQECRMGPFPLLKVADFLGYENSRKGVPLHEGILDAFMDGMGFGETDRLVIVDLCPNRQAEFARAAVNKMIETEGKSCMRYVGLFRPEHADVKADLSGKIYSWWDSSSAAPAKRRTRDDVDLDAVAVPLQILSLQGSKPVWPSSLEDKFPAGTPEHAKLLLLNQEFLKEFPKPRALSQVGRQASSVSQLTQRLAAECDYSQDGEPLDLERCVDLATVPVAELKETVLAMVTGRPGKPSIMITAEYGLWIGNTRNVLEESSGVPWRLGSDKELIVVNKATLPLCELLRLKATEEGLVNVEVESHVVLPKPPTAAAADDAETQLDDDEALFGFRYDVAPTVSCKTSVFKPAVLSKEETETVRAVSLAALFSGNYDRLPRNKIATVAWEAVVLQPLKGCRASSVESVVTVSGTPPKIMPIKPKIYLTCSVRLPPQSWCKVSS